MVHGFEHNYGATILINVSQVIMECSSKQEWSNTNFLFVFRLFIYKKIRTNHSLSFVFRKTHSHYINTRQVIDEIRKYIEGHLNVLNFHFLLCYSVRSCSIGRSLVKLSPGSSSSWGTCTSVVSLLKGPSPGNYC